jgi:hypothetical protein
LQSLAVLTKRKAFDSPRIQQKASGMKKQNQTGSRPNTSNVHSILEKVLARQILPEVHAKATFGNRELELADTETTQTVYSRMHGWWIKNMPTYTGPVAKTRDSLVWQSNRKTMPPLSPTPGLGAKFSASMGSSAGPVAR